MRVVSSGSFAVGDKVIYVKRGNDCQATIGRIYKITKVDKSQPEELPYLLDGLNSHWCDDNQIIPCSFKNYYELLR